MPLTIDFRKNALFQPSRLCPVQETFSYHVFHHSDHHGRRPVLPPKHLRGGHGVFPILFHRTVPATHATPSTGTHGLPEQLTVLGREAPIRAEGVEKLGGARALVSCATWP